MSYYDKQQRSEPTLSYEVFPPKNAAGWGALYETLAAISQRSPDFISVTYGAGGSTREKTLDLVSRIQRELEIPGVAHLTCVGHSRQELSGILNALEAAGIGGIMALRGDPPRGQKSFTPHAEGFSHASDLIALARPNFQFRIGCAFYPEKHPEAATLDEDIAYLKLKQDQGADFAVSQLFFDNDAYYRFRERACLAGVAIPLVAGIMPVSSLSQLRRFQDMSGATIPAKLTKFLGEGDDEVITARGIEYGLSQCIELLDNRVAGLHLYTLNRSNATTSITDELRGLGYLPVRS